jgi:hypothetical protein
VVELGGVPTFNNLNGVVCPTDHKPPIEDERAFFELSNQVARASIAASVHKDIHIQWMRVAFSSSFGPTKRDGDARFDHMPPRYYSGPVSDHFDGARFFDPHGVPARSRRDLLRWFVVPRPATLPSCHASDDRLGQN